MTNKLQVLWNFEREQCAVLTLMTAYLCSCNTAHVGRIIFSPRFAVTTMATGPKMKYCVLLNAVDPPEIKTTHQKEQTLIKCYWRTAFAWITNFMN